MNLTEKILIFERNNNITWIKKIILLKKIWVKNWIINLYKYEYKKYIPIEDLIKNEKETNIILKKYEDSFLILYFKTNINYLKNSLILKENFKNYK